MSLFFEIFLNAMMDMCDEFISMPKNATELLPITRYYENVGLPGCCGSIDVVHVHWSQCPAGDLNGAKGKETFPSLAFECVTTSIGVLWVCMDRSLDPEMTRRL